MTMNIEEHLKKLTELSIAIDKTLDEPRNSYAASYIRPRLIKALVQAVEEAKGVGVTTSDINELVAELEITIGRRPINLEYFWDPRRMAKGWKGDA